ncbi:DEAD/DEAH box helicase [Massilimicrobiota timonensis]|uniref:Helicase SNF2 n=1 Tax=Massilimicrobiota timonensis TaxID=1776392 RepID=A0A1Y4SSY7_9FIRM|nr:DEAD/DEAH box helicase [Massilimicrobiota timonensis]OUQ32062.1 helicase SNF2 [Massilimicrobiota timonensis]
MKTINFMQHQKEVLEKSKDYKNVAYYLDMGLGKTFIGAEKLINKGKNVNLVVCQKSKVTDWIEHFKNYYDHEIYDLTNKKSFEEFIQTAKVYDYIKVVGVINYDLAFRRKELLELQDFTLMLDESSLIQNDKSKRTKFILKMKYDNVILLSGTPTSGKYENLWSQCHLLGWNISKRAYDITYVNFKKIVSGDFQHNVVDKNDPYKNVERLKRKMREHGAIFMKTEEVIDLPEQTFIELKCKTSSEYKTFIDNDYVSLKDVEFIGDSDFSKRLCERQLCSVYNRDKLKMFEDLIQSTNDRIVVFYNFNVELETLKDICRIYDKPVSEVNGETKDLKNYEKYSNSITLVQYQAGALGLNLQKANKIIYFTLTDKSELFEQSKKRIHRIGQENRCFYYILLCSGSIEESIYQTLKERKDYTDDLFKEYKR